jgi:hypothetical protein
MTSNQRWIVTPWSGAPPEPQEPDLLADAALTAGERQPSHTICECGMIDDEPHANGCSELYSNLEWEN